MPRSPNHNRSNSRQRGKRDYKYSHKDSQEKNYGGESRKKVHINDYYENDAQEERQRLRKVQDDDRQKRNESYEQRASISIVSKQVGRKKNLQPESQIKVHFRFRPIKVKLQQDHEQQIMKLLRTHVSKNQWFVDHFQKSPYSRSGYFQIEFGFKYDSDAYAYLKDKSSEIDLTINKQKIDITAQPTKVFRFLIDQMEEKKKKSGKSRSASQQQEKRERKETKERKKSGKKRRDSSLLSQSQSSSRSSSSSRSRRSSRKKQSRHEDSKRRHRTQYKNDKDRSKQRERDRERQRKRSPGNQSTRRQSKYDNGNNYNITSQPALPPSRSIKQASLALQKQLKQHKTLYFFGIPHSVNSKDMDNLLYNHQKGPFKHQELMMRRMKNSICEYTEGRFEQKDALRLLQLADKMEVKGHPFIVLESDSGDQQRLRAKLSQFQINIQFPQQREPYYLLKWLRRCGRVIQIITLNKLTQSGKSEYYNITFNSKQICDQIKQSRHKQIMVEQVTLDNFINVFRPNSKTELILEAGYMSMGNKDNDNQAGLKGYRSENRQGQSTNGNNGYRQSNDY